MSILIGLLTCHDDRERDDLCEATWTPAARALGMRVVYLIGEGRFASETWLDGDYLRIPCPDTYPALPQKSAALFRWALTQPWDVLVKADNDSLIIPQRLAAIDMAGIDYLGCEPGGRNRGYASGAGYLLSRRAVSILAERMKEKTGNEDQIAGRHLRRAGIQLVQDERIDPWGKRPPTPSNDTAISHHLDLWTWARAWDTLSSQHPIR